jgi:hypothetical protein
MKVVLIISLRLAGSTRALGNPRGGHIAIARGFSVVGVAGVRARSLRETTSTVGPNAL